LAGIRFGRWCGRVGAIIAPGSSYGDFYNTGFILIAAALYGKFVKPFAQYVWDQLNQLSTFSFYAQRFSNNGVLCSAYYRLP
jgi:hypothetical protein